MNETYDKNMALVRKLFPEFADLIEKTPDVGWLEATKKDSPVNYMVGLSDKAVKFPLWKETPDEDYAEIIKTSGIRLYNQEATLMFGISAGHGLRLLLDKKEPKHIIIVVEPVMQMLRIAFSEHDFTKEIQEGTLLICPGKAEMSHAIGYLQGSRVIQEWGMLVDRTAKGRSEYWQLMNQGMDMLNQEISNIGTVSSHGKEMANNDIATLPYLIRSRGVKELKGLFFGKPAIVVATGPSLSKNIHMLKEVCGKRTAVIIAVAQALRPLLAYGVRPDFICTVDFGEVNMSHLAGLMDETIPLVTVTKTYAPMLKAYKGPKFVSLEIGPDEPRDSSHAILADSGGLLQGGSVLHTAYGLAIWMGCSPVILVGVDLALGEQSHFGQVDSMGKVSVDANGMINWIVKDPRSTLSKYERHGMGPVQMVDGYYGDMVLTNLGLATFKTTLENYIKWFSERTTTIDSTEGGCYKRGSKRMYLRKAIEKYCQEPIDKSSLEVLLTPSPDGEDRVKRAVTILEREMRELRGAITNAEQGLKWIKKSKKHYRKEDIIRDYNLNAEFSNRCFENCKKVPHLTFALYKVMREIESREYAAQEYFDFVKEAEKEGKKDEALRTDIADFLTNPKNKKEAEKRVRRNIHILSAVKETAELLIKTYKESYNLLKIYSEGDKSSVLDPTGELEPPKIDDAEVYFGQGNWARPLLEADRIKERNFNAGKIIATALNMRKEAIVKAEDTQKKDVESKRDLLPEYLDMVEESKDLGRDKKYNEALAVLGQAVILLPDRIEARWGLATALRYVGKLKESEEMYKELARNYPGVTRYRFELGQLMMQQGRWQEGEELLQEAIQQNPAEHGHYRLELAKMLVEGGEIGKAKELYLSYLSQFGEDEGVRGELDRLN